MTNTNTNTNNANSLETLVARGMITATSRKDNKKFKVDYPTKTCYITAENEAEAQKMIDFGMTQYESQEDKTKFFVVKMAKKVQMYQDGQTDSVGELDGSIESNNIKTKDGEVVSINFIKGKNVGQVFIRVQALLVTSGESVEDVKPENPFLRK